MSAAEKRFDQLEKKIAELSSELAELRLTRAQKALRTFRRNRRAFSGFFACMILLPIALHAFTYPNADFVAGNPAVAADVNARFTAIKTRFDAMENKTWRLISETDVGTATNVIDITGLDGDVDFQYTIRFKIISGNAAGGGYYTLQPNGDATGANYGTKQMGGNANASNVQISTALPTSGIYVGYTSGINQITVCDMTALTKSGSARIFSTMIANAISGTTINDSIGSAMTVWNNTAGNITSLRLISQNANGIGVGSHIEVWARR